MEEVNVGWLYYNGHSSDSDEVEHSDSEHSDSDSEHSEPGLHMLELAKDFVQSGNNVNDVVPNCDGLTAAYIISGFYVESEPTILSQNNNALGATITQETLNNLMPDNSSVAFNLACHSTQDGAGILAALISRNVWITEETLNAYVRDDRFNEGPLVYYLCMDAEGISVLKSLHNHGVKISAYTLNDISYQDWQDFPTCFERLCTSEPGIELLLMLQKDGVSISRRLLDSVILDGPNQGRTIENLLADSPIGVRLLNGIYNRNVSNAILTLRSAQEVRRLSHNSSLQKLPKDMATDIAKMLYRPQV